MRTLSEICDSLTKAIRMELADQRVIFIHAFSAEKIQNPPNKFFVSVSLEEEKQEGFVADKSAIIRAVLIYRVYAPRDADDTELLALCEKLGQAIRIKGEEIVDTITMAGAHYDTKARAVYREIKTGISFMKEVIR